MLAYLMSALLTIAAVVAPVANSSTNDKSDPSAKTQPVANPALESATRDFRIATYNAFREDRPEFNRRRTAWDQVHSAWVAAGKLESDQTTLVAWLEQATLAASSGDQRFPEAPKFGPAIAEDLPARSPESMGTVRAADPLAPNSPQNSSNDLSANSQPAATQPSVVANTPALRNGDAPNTGSSWWSGLGNSTIAPARSAADDHSPAGVIAQSPSSSRIPFADSAPAISPPANSSIKVQVSELPVQPQVVSPNDAASTTVANAPVLKQTARNPVPYVTALPGSGSQLPARRTASTPVPADWVSNLPRVEATENANNTPNAGDSNLLKAIADTSSRTGQTIEPISHPTAGVAADLPRRSTTTGEPLPAESAQPRTALNDSSTLRADPFITELPLTSEQQNAATINLGELAGRAAGYQVALRTLNGVLQDEPILNVDQLTTLMGELEELSAQRQTLLMYEKLISAEDQARLQQGVQFPKAAIAQLGTRIANERTRLTASDKVASPEYQSQLRKLDELSQRLAKLSSN